MDEPMALGQDKVYLKIMAKDGYAENIKGSAEAVSYTHLDVYKRQVGRFAAWDLSRFSRGGLCAADDPADWAGDGELDGVYALYLYCADAAGGIFSREKPCGGASQKDQAACEGRPCRDTADKALSLIHI